MRTAGSSPTNPPKDGATSVLKVDAFVNAVTLGPT
jgi:hypothetical protein